MGGRNVFLGACYLAVGGVCLLAALFFFVAYDLGGSLLLYAMDVLHQPVHAMLIWLPDTVQRVVQPCWLQPAMGAVWAPTA